MTKSGLSFQDLQLAFHRKGEDGIRLLLSERDGKGKVMVSKSSSVVEKLGYFFRSKQVPSSDKCNISAEKLALHKKRQREGYDLPDPDYLAWLKVQGQESVV